MITLLFYMMMLPFYMLLLSVKLMGKIMKFLFWGVIIILGFMV